MTPIHLFTLKNIPVSGSPFFLILVVILSLGNGSVLNMILFGMAIIFGVLSHEFGHALTAQKFGLMPEIMLHAMGGVTTMDRSAKTAKQDFLITLAGPLTNLVIGGVLLGTKLLLITSGIGFIFNYVPPLWAFLDSVMIVSLVWGIFNLLPIKPMDGSKVLDFLLRKFLSPNKAEATAIVIGALFSAAVLIWAIIRQNTFMIIIGGYLLLINGSYFVALFKKDKGASASSDQRLVQAEGIYEKGLIAARNHDWKSLERCGHQMKKLAISEDQLMRAYEFLTIANTNLGKYQDALSYAPHAKQSDAVKQAVARCKQLS
ncbi:MAG: site-2 protease family protein [Proteobacteria bacterium]|nr:site-2 protease family protein [Pseudomonadota bacterium]